MRFLAPLGMKRFKLWHIFALTAFAACSLVAFTMTRVVEAAQTNLTVHVVWDDGLLQPGNIVEGFLDSIDPHSFPITVELHQSVGGQFQVIASDVTWTYNDNESTYVNFNNVNIDPNTQLIVQVTIPNNHHLIEGNVKLHKWIAGNADFHQAASWQDGNVTIDLEYQHVNAWPLP